MRSPVDVISKTRRALPLLAVLVLYACGGGGGDGGTVSNATAVAGVDQDIARNDPVTLDGSASSDPDGDPLTFKWTQIHGPDVTGGVGYLTGVTPAFTAPETVSTVIFALRVNDGSGDSTPDPVQINVMEHTGGNFFVDGDAGSDTTGDGSKANPFASISFAINSIQGPDYDIYVKTRENSASYTETATIRPQPTISLYGGFGPGWVRDVDTNRTRIEGAATAVDFYSVVADAWFSGFDITAADVAAGQDSVALTAAGTGGIFYVLDNVLTGGTAGAAPADGSAGSSYGITLNSLSKVEVRRNQVTSGPGGAGRTGNKGADGTAAKTNGSNGGSPNHYSGGSGGSGGVSSANGGKGGDGGYGVLPTDGKDGGGANGGNGDPVGSGTVGDGGGGAGGGGGNGGSGGVGGGSIDTAGLFVPVDGGKGGNAGNGVGGGGGGGGAGGVGLDGGGGGGGGGGGQGGAGGAGGTGGGASIGILVANVADAIIDSNVINAANGGRGGNGGAGGTGGKGTKGGVGSGSVCSFLGCDAGRSGDGGEGGGGGSGGIGGQGGGGAGGPSYGILIGPNISPSITQNNIASGTGGNGGIGGAAGLGGSPGGSGGSTGGSGGCCAFLLQTAGTAGTGGRGGLSYALFDVDTNDGVTPFADNNTLTAGTAGAGGAINGTAGASADSNF